ncbi:MAG: hypothetical protein WHT46_01455 [Candidatus Geothermincolales bacterium]
MTSSGGAMGGFSLKRARGLSPYNYFLRVCSECGVPLVISRKHVWDENGRITTRDGRVRLMVVERKILDAVISKAGERVGEAYKEILKEAKARDAEAYVRSIVGWRRKAITLYPLAKKPMYRVLCDQARLLGMADGEISKFSRKEEYVFSCTRCYNEILMAGDIMGAIRACEEVDARVDVIREGDEIHFVARVTKDNGWRERVLEFPGEEIVPGNLKYKRCGGCGVPYPVCFLSWDIEGGKITDTFNGEEVTLVDVDGLNASYEEVRRREGSWFDEYMARETKKEVDSLIPRLEWKERSPEERVKDIFFLAYRGMGNPVSTKPVKGGILAEIHNPFNYPLVAGIAASFLARGYPCDFEWKKTEKGKMQVIVRFL